MAQSIFGNRAWCDLIKQKAAERNLVLNNPAGDLLAFHATANTQVTGVRNVNFQIGGVLVNKISLTSLMSGVKVDMLKALGTEKIQALYPETILSHCFTFLGLTGVKTSDFDYVKNAKTLVFTAKDSCVKYTGSFEVIYAS